MDTLAVEVAGLEVCELYREPLTVALPERHPLVAHDTVRVADLRGETLLLLEDGHCLREQALEVCSRVGVRDSQDFRATSLETLRQMVATGDRKSTRLNSSHLVISYAVFCLKKKNTSRIH